MMGDQRQDLVDRYVASKMSLKVGGIAKVRKRVWYAKFKGLFEMLGITDLSRMVVVFNFLDEAKAFHYAKIASSAEESMLVLNMDISLEGKSVAELERLLVLEGF